MGSKHNRKIILFALLTLISLLIVFELFSRIVFGFCDAVIYRQDNDYEYIAEANQNRFRFRNNISYNSKSMRSDELDTNAVIILGFGDSVLNGGTLTDQDSLATSLLSDSLTMITNKKIQFLNISSGSWGPDNCFNYLKKHGSFGAKYIFLFVNSHDSYDNITNEKIVGKNINYPNKQYSFALEELINRYLLPKFGINKSSGGVNSLGINKNKDNVFNTGFNSFVNYSSKNNLNLVIYLHGELLELDAGCYNEQGEEIIRFCKQRGVKLIKDIEMGIEKSDYRDNIHLNEKGQAKMAEIVQNFIIKNKSLYSNLFKSDSISNEN